ncbi:MAG: hypothetical protein QOJ99_5252 [Bryobacterales bacterium]|jgi:hypothetical protein|nr:hypothetical protein [Bryobacterales bacterium]
MNYPGASTIWLMISVFAVPAAAEIRLNPSNLTVVLDFRGERSVLATTEMRREVDRLIEDSGVRLDWRLRSEAPFVANDLVVITFRGSCQFGSSPPLYDEPGPLAFTWMADGEVQPFGEVDCERVVRSVRRAMWGADFGRANSLVGRALGRVVAHELVHMVTRSTHHSGEGLERPALSGRQLIAASLSLDAFDLERLRLSARRR